jgi:hypothetical protein
MGQEIDISKLNKAEVLAALYNNSKPQGMGFLHFTPEDMTKEEAQKHIDECPSFDYLKGRVMKVDLSGDSFDPWLYDRDNGEGSAKRVIENLAK